MRHFSFIFILLFGAIACSSTMTKYNSTKRSNYVITAEEIQNSSATNAFEAVQLLRPHLLQMQRSQRTDPSLTQGAQPAVVYLDGVRYGTFETLQNISAFSVAEIRYMKSNEATNRYGADHHGGAFLVTSK